jgi:hypothetical protein
VRPWPTGPVTLLGDAIHNMTRMAGSGANTALRDADLLRRQLISVAEDRVGLRPRSGAKPDLPPPVHRGPTGNRTPWSYRKRAWRSP